MPRPNYIMDAPSEANRLEEQARLPGYRFEDELRGLTLPFGTHVLDAGCGSGAGARYLMQTFKGISVDACDASTLRLVQARTLDAGSGEKKIRFFESRLEQIDSPDGAYDFILCRYVFEHLKTHQPVADEFFRVTKPGGRVHVIDFDGIIYNFHHQNRKLADMMTLVQQGLGLDLYVGRKLPHLLATAGFTDITWKVEVVSFKGESLIDEQKIMEQRISCALPGFAALLGSEAAALEFKDLYCQEMMNPASTLFYNKFLVEGRKPV